MSDYITKVIDKNGAEFDIRDERVPASTTADAGKSVVVDAQGKLALGEAQSTDIAPSQIKATAADSGKIISIDAQGSGTLIDPVASEDEFAFLSFDFDSSQATTGTISLTQAQINACTAARFIYVKGFNAAWGSALTGIIEKETSLANYCQIVADYYLYGEMRMYSAIVDLDLANGTLTWRNVGKSTFNAAGKVIAINVIVNGIYQNQMPDLTVKKLYSTGIEELLNTSDYHVECDTSALGASMLYVDYGGFSFVKPVTVEEYIPDLPEWIDATKIVNNALKSYAIKSTCPSTIDIYSKYRNGNDILTITEIKINAIGNSTTSLSQVEVVNIHEGITTISSNDFIRNCPNLQDLYLPASMSTFNGVSMSGEYMVHVDPANQSFIDENGIIYDSAKTSILAYSPAITATEYVMPNTVTEFGSKVKSAYLQRLTVGDACSSLHPYQCIALTDIIVSANNTHYDVVNGIVVEHDNHNSVIAVPPARFAGTTVAFDSNITMFQWGACYNMQAAAIQWPTQVSSFDTRSFSNATGLGAIDLASIGGIISQAAFRDTDITSLRLGIHYWGNSAFAGCASLTTITLVWNGNGVVRSDFGECPNITSLNFEGTMSDWSLVNKADNWNVHLKEYVSVIHCSDGDVSIL